MTRQEYIAVCSRCKNRKFNPKSGIICGLTNDIAAFQNTCESFDEDVFEAKRLETSGYNPHANADNDHAEATKNILWGAIWCVGGIAATVADIGYIFYGAIVFGGFQLIQGLIGVSRS